MNITVSKSELLGKLKSIGGIIQPKNSNPQYGNFLLEAKDGILTATAGTDGGIISTNIECLLSEDISITLDAKTILDGLKEIPEQPLVITITAEKTYLNVRVQYSNGKFELVGGVGNEYPKISIDKTETPFILNGEEFLNGIKQVQVCCANDELRPVMNGVYLEKNADSVFYVATDGASLGVVSNKVDSNGERSSFILPARIARFISQILSPSCEELTITVGPSNVLFQFESYSLICRMIEGRYPNFRSVIPKNNDKVARFGKAELISALKRVSVFCSATSSLVIMKFENDLLTLSGHDYDFSTSAEETVSISYNSQPIQIGFKSSKLIELLQSIPSSEVTMTLLEPSKAVVMYRADGTTDDLLYLIMPLLINQ